MKPAQAHHGNPVSFIFLLAFKKKKNLKKKKKRKV